MTCVTLLLAGRAPGHVGRPVSPLETQPLVVNTTLMKRRIGIIEGSNIKADNITSVAVVSKKKHLSECVIFLFSFRKPLLEEIVKLPLKSHLHVHSKSI